MATDAAVVTPPVVVVPTQEGFWSRVGNTLKSWGTKVVDAAKGFFGWIGRGIKRLWNTKPVQWVAKKLAGPIGMVVAPVAALVAMPGVATTLAVAACLGVCVTGAAVWSIHRQVKKHGSVEAWQDSVVEGLYGPPLERQNDIPVTADETIESRYNYLTELSKDAWARDDRKDYSDLTGRMHLLVVRKGASDGKLKKDASVSDIHSEARRQAEFKDRDFGWDFGVMYRAALSEDKRLKEAARLKAEQATLKPVPS